MNASGSLFFVSYEFEKEMHWKIFGYISDAALDRLQSKGIFKRTEILDKE
jgi:hypothetical protein